MSDVLARYEAWSAERQAIFDVEAETGRLDHDAIHANEDDGAGLLDEMARAMRVARDGVSAISEALGDHFYHYGVGFTCSEAAAYYEAQLALGLTYEAEHFMRHHAESDDPREGDLHEPVGDDSWRALPDPYPDYPGDDEPRLTGHPPREEGDESPTD